MVLLRYPTTSVMVDDDDTPSFQCHIPYEDNHDLVTHAEVNGSDLVLADEFTQALIGPTPAQYAPVRLTFWPKISEAAQNKCSGQSQ